MIDRKEIARQVIAALNAAGRIYTSDKVRAIVDNIIIDNRQIGTYDVSNYVKS